MALCIPQPVPRERDHILTASAHCRTAGFLVGAICLGASHRERELNQEYIIFPERLLSKKVKVRANEHPKHISAADIFLDWLLSPQGSDIRANIYTKLLKTNGQTTARGSTRNPSFAKDSHFLIKVPNLMSVSFWGKLHIFCSLLLVPKIRLWTLITAPSLLFLSSECIIWKVLNII